MESHIVNFLSPDILIDDLDDANWSRTPFAASSTLVMIDVLDPTHLERLMAKCELAHRVASEWSSSSEIINTRGVDAILGPNSSAFSFLDVDASCLQYGTSR